MAYYPGTALERSMKIQEVIMRAMSGEITWIDAAEIIGVSPRSMRRWKARYEEYGYDGLYDRRLKRPSPKRVPVEQARKVVRLYRETYFDFNVRHFYEKLQEEHGINLSYTWVKTALQTAGLVSKRRKRGPHREQRPRRPMVGMMLHVDGSTHGWLPGREGEKQDMLVVMDDADNDIYDMFLVEEEGTVSVMESLRRVVEEKGIFCSLYTDRASHFVYTPKEGKPDLNRPTHAGRALKQLGIQLILAWSPQARGRSERMFETLQGRVPQELRLKGITTIEEANAYFRTTLRKKLNKVFKKAPENPRSAFGKLGDIDLDKVFSLQHERVVANDNTVSYANNKLQIEQSELRISFAKCKVIVYEHLDGRISIGYGPHIIGRYDKDGRPLKKRGSVESKNHLSRVYVDIVGEKIVAHNRDKEAVLCSSVGESNF
jgi:transposase